MVVAHPGDTRTTFPWYCRWVYDCCRCGPGKRLVVIPELWRHCSAESIPQQVALLAPAGRELGIELVLDTQRPEAIHPGIATQPTELVCFRLMAHETLRAVERLWRDAGIDADRGQAAHCPSACSSLGTGFAAPGSRGCSESRDCSK